MNGPEPYQEIMTIDDKLKIYSITAFAVYHAEIKKEFQSSSGTIIQDKRTKTTFSKLYYSKRYQFRRASKSNKGSI